MMRILLPLFLMITALPVMAQPSMPELAKAIQRLPDEAGRLDANAALTDSLSEYLRQHPDPAIPLPDSMDNISVVLPPDRSFRLLTWIVPSPEHERYRYFGLCQQFASKTVKRDTVITLVDVSDTLSNPESARLKDGNWYGAVCYQVVARKKSGKMYYTLLGWKGNSRHTTSKVIDVLVTGRKLQFGYPYFKMGKTYRSRVLFEFTAAASMSLRYEPSKKMIVFDHLSAPKGESLSPASRGPDGSYDALRYKSGRWLLVEDIDIGTTWKPKKRPDYSSPSPPPER
jgi:hypothetical protein